MTLIINFITYVKVEGHKNIFHGHDLQIKVKQHQIQIYFTNEPGVK
mgnify:CR=1 FL=1